MRTIGQWTYTYRKTTIFLWLIVVMSLSYFAFQLPTVLHGSGFNTEGQFKQVEQILKEDFDIPESTLILLFEKEDQVNEETFHLLIEETLKDLQNVEGLGKIVSPLEHKDMIAENTAYALLQFDRHFDNMKESIRQIRNKMPTVENVFIGLTGGAVINEDMSVASQQDLIRAEFIGVPIALVVLLFAFGGLVAAAVPLIIGFITVLCSMGILYFFGDTLNLSIFLLNVVPMIGLALGIDFALLYVNRFREELKKHDISEAIKISSHTSGRAIIFSGVCVFLGLSGLLFIQIDIFQTVAIGGMIVVLFSVISAITFLPSLLSILGHRINRFMILKTGNSDQQSKWRTFATFVMKRPLILSICTFLLLAIAIIPVIGIELTIPDAESLPPDYESRITYEKYDEVFVAEERSKVIMVIEGTDSFEKKEELEKLEELVNQLESDSLVIEVESLFSHAGDVTYEEFYGMINHPQVKTQIEPLMEQLTSQNKTLVHVHLGADDHSAEAKDWVREWEQRDLPLTINIGGYAKFHQEIFDEIYKKIPYVLTVVFISTFIVLYIAFRSILIPLKAILMNIASLCASFGILVWLFQGGHLGIDQASIALMIPVFIFGIVFGLSMDYEVFLISRMYEIYKQTKDNDYATLEGLVSTSRLITSAAIIIIVITGAFAFTGVVPVKQIGIGMALAILIDATVVRMVLVPSLMKLLGEWNWWAPSFRKK